VKEIVGIDGVKQLRPEYEELKRLSLSAKLSLIEVNLRLQGELTDHLNEKKES